MTPDTPAPPPAPRTPVLSSPFREGRNTPTEEEIWAASDAHRVWCERRKIAREGGTIP